MTNVTLLEGEVFLYYPKSRKYKISNCGRIYSYKSKRLLSGYVGTYENKNGDKKPSQVTVTVGGMAISVHLLVAELFLPPKPHKDLTIDHIDRNPLNNHASNLRWADMKMQMANRVFNRIPCKKLSTADVEDLYQKTITETLTKVAADNGLTKTQLYTILRFTHPLY